MQISSNGEHGLKRGLSALHSGPEPSEFTQSKYIAKRVA